MDIRRLLVLSLAVVLCVGVAASAQAAPYCSGAGCNGKNPQNTNCQSNAYRVYGIAYPIPQYASPSNTVGQVELWYSPYCNANWSRATGWWGQPAVWVVQGTTRYPSNGAAAGCSGNTCWSPMRNGSYQTMACGGYSIYSEYIGCSPWG